MEAKLRYGVTKFVSKFSDRGALTMDAARIGSIYGLLYTQDSLSAKQKTDMKFYFAVLEYLNRPRK